MKITRSMIENSMSKPYTMSFLEGSSEFNFFVQCMNMGIDSYLEACYVPDRGDSIRIMKTPVGNRVYCVISKESMPTLLRRLTEDVVYHPEETMDFLGETLAADILESLGFDVSVGCYKVVTNEENYNDVI